MRKNTSNNNEKTNEKPLPGSQQPTKNDDDNYHALFEQATDAIMVTDFKGNFTDVNSGFCAMFGYTKDELLELNISALLVKEERQANPVRFDLLAAGQNIFMERRMVHKKGSIICVESNEKKFTENRVLIIARNITERKRTESILQKSEANLQAIFDTTDTIYVLLNKDLRIISYNRCARDFAEKELGRNIATDEYFIDYFPYEERASLSGYMKTVLTGRQINYEISYPQPGNVLHWYHVRLFPIANGNNKVYGIMMALSDITEKTVLEQKLEEERIKKHYEITDAVITAEENERQEIGLELHDNVNQLLGAARLYIGMAKESIGTKKVQMINEVDRLVDMAIKEIRNLSHSLISPFIDEYGLIKAIDHLIGTISKDGLTIEKEIEIDEKSIPDKLSLTIYRIIQEQLNNILKHAKATTIKITLLRDKDTITLSVKDNGAGFDTSKTSKGIGLMNIRTRASLFKGKVDIISSPGNGCELVISLIAPGN